MVRNDVGDGSEEDIAGITALASCGDALLLSSLLLFTILSIVIDVFLMDVDLDRARGDCKDISEDLEDYNYCDYNDDDEEDDDNVFVG